MQKEKDLENNSKTETEEALGNTPEESVKTAEELKAEKIADKKKKLKNTAKILVRTVAAVLITAVVAYLLLYIIQPKDETLEYEDWQFFEPDYEKNIFEDEVYMGMNRGIHYVRDGADRILTEDNVDNFHVTARFFYDYLNCIIEGDYENYPNFYTERCRNDKNFNCPEEFTMQALYDIHVTLDRIFPPEKDGDPITEIFIVEYRIYQNNGTYRRDILPGDTRARVFEVVIDGGDVKINSITYNQILKDESE